MEIKEKGEPAADSWIIQEGEKIKYFAIIDADVLENFKAYPKEYNELGLVVKDKNGYERGIVIKPLFKPLLVNPRSGESVFITENHIKALLEYEKMRTIEKTIENITKNYS